MSSIKLEFLLLTIDNFLHLKLLTLMHVFSLSIEIYSTTLLCIECRHLSIQAEKYKVTWRKSWWLCRLAQEAKKYFEDKIKNLGGSEREQ